MGFYGPYFAQIQTIIFYSVVLPGLSHILVQLYYKHNVIAMGV